MLFIFGSHSGKVLGQHPFIPFGRFDPVDYSGDNWVSPLSLYPVEVSEIPEVPMLLHDLSVPDYDFLVHSLTFFYDIHVSHLGLRLMRHAGIIEQFRHGLLI